MNIIDRWDLPDGLHIARVDSIPEATFQALVHENLLASNPIVPWEDKLDETTRVKQQKLKRGVEGRFRLRLLVMQGENIIGLSVGWQQAAATEFYMGISLINEPFRRRGLYNKLLDIVLSTTAEMGFSAVKSRHINTNTPIQIAKLQKGFIINGFELDEVMGPLLNMIYYHDKTKRRAANFRSGDLREASIMAGLLES